MWNLSRWIVELAAGGLYIGALTLAAVRDARTGEIPDRCHVLLLLAGILRICTGRPWWPSALAAFLLLGGAILLFSLWRDHMGGGDVKLIACAGLAVGLQGSLQALIIALPPANVFVLVRIRVAPEKGQSVALAPFLAWGYELVYVYQLFGGIVGN